MIDTLSNIVERVGEKIGITGNVTYDARIKRWVNEAYREVNRYFPWPEMLFRSEASGPFLIQTVANQDWLMMPKRVEMIHIISQRQTDAWLQFEPTHNFIRRFISSVDTDERGAPRVYTDDGFVSVFAQPTVAATLDVVSSSASDSAINVRIRGRDANGEEIDDVVALTGTTPVVTSKSFARVEEVSKADYTAGIITITQTTVGTVISRLGPLEYRPERIRIRFHNTPSIVTTLYGVFSSKPRFLRYDEDVPQFECSDAIVEGSTYRALRAEEMYAKASEEKQQMYLTLSQMRKKIIGQENRVMKFVPFIPDRYNIELY